MQNKNVSAIKYYHDESNDHRLINLSNSLVELMCAQHQ